MSWHSKGQKFDESSDVSGDVLPADIVPELNPAGLSGAGVWIRAETDDLQEHV